MQYQSLLCCHSKDPCFGITTSNSDHEIQINKSLVSQYYLLPFFVGDERLKLDQLLEWWRVLSPDYDSRLLLVVDTEQSYHWVHQIASTSHLYTAIQTWQSKVSLDSELGSCTKIGTFTIDWVDYNCSATGKVNWRSYDQTTQAVYAVSNSWTDFQFRSPTPADIVNYWNSNFQKTAKLMIDVTNGLRINATCLCSDCVLRCLRRKKMKWLPPLEYDTGHGFKLVYNYIWSSCFHL